MLSLRKEALGLRLIWCRSASVCSVLQHVRPRCAGRGLMHLLRTTSCFQSWPSAAWCRPRPERSHGRLFVQLWKLLGRFILIVSPSFTLQDVAGQDMAMYGHSYVQQGPLCNSNTLSLCIGVLWTAAQRGLQDSFCFRRQDDITSVSPHRGLLPPLPVVTPWVLELSMKPSRFADD